MQELLHASMAANLRPASTQLTPGHYSDAIAKGHGVHLLVTESSGAMSAPLVAILRALAQCVKLPDACDTTVYGSSRAAPRSFYPHHLAAISAAIVQADALALTNAAQTMGCLSVSVGTRMSEFVAVDFV